VTAKLRIRSIDGRFDPDPITRALLSLAGIAVLYVFLTSVHGKHMTLMAAILLFVAALAWILPDGAPRRTATALAPALLMIAFALIMWHPPKDTVLDGAILGGLTSLLAVGLVIVYRANKIINFAQAEMGAVPANIAFLLILAKGWPYFLGAFSGLLAAILLGVLVEFLFLRRFFNSPRLIATVATIGVQSILIFVSIFLPRWIGGSTNQITLPNELPWSFHLNTVLFDGNQILVLIVVPITLVLLMAFFRFSAIGTALRASAESADRAGTLGIPVRRLQSVLWAIVGVLAFITIFLRIGVVGISITSALDPTVLLAALGAAVIGRMERLPTTVAAAIALGVVSETVSNAWGYDAAQAVVISGIIAIALLAQGRIPGANRLQTAAISTWQSTREVRPIPAELRRERPVIAAQVALGSVLAIIAVLIPVVFAANRVQEAGTMMIYAIIGIALVMLTGWAGQVSLGQMAIVGISGAAAGWFATNFTNPIVGGTIPAMIVGGIVGALVTLLVGVPTLRARGFTFAVMSFGLALITEQYLLNEGHSFLHQFFPQWGQQTVNGFEQLPRPPVLSIKQHNIINLNNDTRFYWLMIVMLALVIFAARGLRKTRTGRVLIGVRENERAAEAYSISGTRTLILAFVITGFITGMAGALFQLQQQDQNAALFGTAASLQIFAMVVVGGLGSIGGALLGALFVFGATYWLPPDYTLLATGAGMLLVLMILPGGLGAAFGDARDGALRWYARRRNIRVPSLVADTLVAQPPPTVEDAAIAAAVAESAEHVDDFAEVRE
jgi:branched-chain amino acid transport system permease protein